MPRDYAKKTKGTRSSSSRASSSKQQRPAMERKGTVPVLWMVAGLLIGLFVAGLVFLKADHATSYKKKLKAKIENVLKAKDQNTAGKVKGPKFDFYTILPKEKVWVPKSADKPIAAPKEPSAPIAYIIQVAAFKKHSDAEKLKAQLLLKGYATHIKSADSFGWYRVWVGPYKSINTAEVIQVKVSESNNLNGLIMRMEEK